MENRAEKTWTQEEDNYLLDELGNITISLMAKRLGRSKGSVENRLWYLGCTGIASSTGSFRVYEFAEILGIDPSTVRRWIKEEGLPAKQFYKNGNKDTKGRHYYIFPDEFWRWAKKHQDLVHFKKLQRGVLLPEPDWLEEAIRNDKKGAKYRVTWTEEEDKLVLRLYYKEGLTQESIGKRIGRSRKAVNKRLVVLREKNKM